MNNRNIGRHSSETQSHPIDMNINTNMLLPQKKKPSVTPTLQPIHEHSTFLDFLKMTQYKISYAFHKVTRFMHKHKHTHTHTSTEFMMHTLFCVLNIYKFYLLLLQKMNKAEGYPLMKTTKFAKLSYVQNLEVESKINERKEQLKVNFN
jgi:hypothetical protein